MCVRDEGEEEMQAASSQHGRGCLIMWDFCMQFTWERRGGGGWGGREICQRSQSGDSLLFAYRLLFFFLHLDLIGLQDEKGGVVPGFSSSMPKKYPTPPSGNLTN